MYCGKYFNAQVPTCDYIWSLDVVGRLLFGQIHGYAKVSNPFPADDNDVHPRAFIFVSCAWSEASFVRNHSLVKSAYHAVRHNIQEHNYMEGLFLTIALSIVVPLLIILLWFFVIFIVVKKCILSKRLPSNDGDVALCRPEECVAETTAITDCPDEPILHHSSDARDCQRSSFTELVLQLPLYSTLPRNTSRISSDCPRDHPAANTRHGYRLYPCNYSPFSQNTSTNRNETMQALSRYCDRYIADAYYDQPPPYSSSENVHEHSQLTSTICEREGAAYGCETWIWLRHLQDKLLTTVIRAVWMKSKRSNLKTI